MDALFRDLLIGVTNFFRDRDAFAVLESKVIPSLFHGKPAGATVRVWCAGCSTGEEAYSLAILLTEHMEQLRQGYALQLFATDIDGRAIAAARAGLFPSSIAADISPERLTRFFTLEPGGQTYRIHKSIRDLLVFSEQDLIKDPPFSRLDLISCRNLLIYLDGNLQKKLIPLFHYALNPSGVLFLGSSEGLGEFDSLFNVIDRKAKLYQRKVDLLGVHRNKLTRFMVPDVEVDTGAPSRGETKKAFLPKLSLRELMVQAFLRHIAIASALVNAGGDIVYLHGRTGMYLEPTAGEAGIQNILRMAREGLRPALSNALNQAVTTQDSSFAPSVRVKTNGHYTRVDVGVHPVANLAPEMPDAPLYLVMLQEVAEPSRVPDGDQSQLTLHADAQARIDALTQELRIKDEYLQSAHEELESSNEELRSSNEEMHSVNEELQSTNEELETSKEELQSVNEELTTVNIELHSKVADLSRANNDMNNLLSGTGIGTVFVDHQLRILRFTPAVSNIIHLILSDVGRPVAHMASNLVDYNNLVTDIKTVLNTLIPVEREVQTREGQWYNLRIQPYRTLDNVIEGAVISFVDVSDIMKTRQELRQAQHLLRLAAVARDARDAIILQDLVGRTLLWNPAAERLYGWSEAQALQLNLSQRVPPALRDHALAQTLQHSSAELLQAQQTQRLTADGRVLEVSVIATALSDDSGKVYAIATTERARIASPAGGAPGTAA